MVQLKAKRDGRYHPHRGIGAEQKRRNERLRRDAKDNYYYTLWFNSKRSGMAGTIPKGK